ncbi:MAG TPA: transglycosylase SLT domain-containing protein [Terriglobia bacterium]|nr:transglycosylase SLT domain-containing protein [Terriglobia bacterium]
MKRIWRLLLPLLTLALSACAGAPRRAALGPNSAFAPPQKAAPPQVQAAAAAPLQPAAVAHTSPPPVTSDDSASKLLSRADALYQAGVKDYSAGNLDQAKDEFDQAVALLLESNLDLQSDDRLNSEFNRLVEDISNLELAALQRGGPMSSHAYEPPPIESFAGLTFPVDPNVRERAQQELSSVQADLPLVSNDYVAGVLTFLQNHGRHYIQRVLAGKALYGPMIEDTLRQAGLPQDLIYLAAGESSFDPFAVSSKGAKGIWQFMADTGALYGLKRNRWVDEREDPVKSTQAAARHLKDLYKTYGDWFLAMAAYDWSPNGLQKAIEKTGYADYWKLRQLRALPSETENYVPIFLATALIAKDPQAYGFEMPSTPAMETDQVVVSEPTDIRLVAGLIDHPVEELVRLNPSMLTWITPPNDSNFTLNLPAGTKDQFEKTIAAIPPDRREWWRAYRVEPGETLASVAHKFHVSTVSLRDVNRVTDNSELDAGSHVLVPLSPVSEASLVRVHERQVLRARQYRVKPGDTIELVADRFDVTPYQIRHWNHLKGSKLTAGRSLVVFVPAPAPSHHRTTSKRHTTAAHTQSSHTSKTKRTQVARASGGSASASP